MYKPQAKSEVYLPLTGKTALVTGGDSGISLTFASRLLELGCNVVVADIAFEHGSSSDRHTKNEVYPPKLTFVRTDVTDWVQLNGAFSVAVDTYGSIDIVCPAAGMSLPSAPTSWNIDHTQYAPSSAYGPLELNLHHPIRCAQLAFDYFSHTDSINPRGVVILVSRIVSPEIARDFPDYATAKLELNQYVQSMSDGEHLGRIRCVAVALKDPCGQARGTDWMQHTRTKSSRERSAVDVMVAACLNHMYLDGAVLEVS